MWDVIYNALIIIGVVTLTVVGLAVWPSGRGSRHEGDAPSENDRASF